LLVLARALGLDAPRRPRSSERKLKADVSAAANNYRVRWAQHGLAGFFGLSQTIPLPDGGELRSSISRLEIAKRRSKGVCDRCLRSHWPWEASECKRTI
jgi:hypothetical protein